MDSSEWDVRYSSAEQLWSGQPNGALVAEIHTLTPGRVLDVGCGEGADAIWLAERGWDVTALDVSGVALARAAEQAERVGVQVRWLHSGFLEAALPSASFDLITAQYPVLLRTEQRVAERALLDAVAPGGVLLFVHHPIPTPDEMHGHDHEHESGFNHEDYVSPSDVAAVLDSSWLVEVHEVRPRHLSTGAGAGHTDDLILKARRLH